MSEKTHNELIDHIGKSLRKHEEPYSPGAWEAFQQYKKRKSRAHTGMIALSVAASLIFLLSLMFILNDFERTAPEKPIIERQEGRNIPKPGISEGDATASSSEQRKSSVIRHEKTSVEKAESNDDFAPEGVIASLPEDTPNIISLTPQQPGPVLLSPGAVPGLPDLQMVAEYPAVGVWPILYQEHHPDRIVKRDKSKNFSFGLTYAPLMNANDTKTDWSMGGGLYTEWNFARDLAFSSGILIAQNQLEYDKEENMEGVGTDNLAYVQVDLVSLEIPLNLRYFLTDNISVSAGISSAAFLKEHYNYTYEYQLEIQVLEYREGTGFEPVIKEVTVTESEKQSEPSLNAVDWAAFYTFSLSYQYDIAGKHTLSLEPFVKLPSGYLTSRHIKYYTGGLQMKISF